MSKEKAPALDAELMARVALGNREAVGELYDRYVRLLMPVAQRIVGSTSDAEDVLHDAFVTLPARSRHYTPTRGSVAAWLVILVRNLSIDRTRRKAVRQAAAFASSPPGPSESSAPRDPEVATQVSSQQARVRRALAALPDAQRQTLITAFFEGLSYPEIATRDGVSLGTVKSRAARGLAALRNALGEETLSVDDANEEG